MSYEENYKACRQKYKTQFVDNWERNLGELGERIQVIKDLTFEGYQNDNPTSLEAVQYHVWRLITDDYELMCSPAANAARELTWAATELVEATGEHW